jgi:hypothetical protein
MKTVYNQGIEPTYPTAMWDVLNDSKTKGLHIAQERAPNFPRVFGLLHTKFYIPLVFLNFHTNRIQRCPPRPGGTVFKIPLAQ